MNEMKLFLAATEIIDLQHATVFALAHDLAAGSGNPVETAKRLFEWVRDEIPHSRDYRLDPVTCSASEVLTARTGFCYAKSHLLAALLRANGIPAGFCYQRLSRDDNGPPYSLHGLNAVFLPETGWYRIDARGNRRGVDAQFTSPVERLAFIPGLAGEADLPEIWPEPLPVVVEALHAWKTSDELWEHLPDIQLIRP